MKLYTKQSQRFTLGRHNSLMKITLGLFMVFIAVSCEDFLEIDPPQSQVIGDLVFEEKALAESALAGVYLSLKDEFFNSGDIPTYMGVYADELYYTGTQEFIYGLFVNNDVLPSSRYGIFWNDGYTIIYKVNAIINGLEKSSGIVQEDKNQLLGEAVFLRACTYFYLTNLYGDIPYTTSLDYTVNAKLSRTPQQEVYNNIVSELQRAKELLTDNYPSTERVHVNKWVASAFLARVYLYMEQWEEAENESTALINNSTYTREDDLDKLFLKESTSTIWSLKSYDRLNASEGSYFNIAGPSSLQYKSILITNHLAEAFEVGDQRRQHWLGSGELTNGQTVYYMTKYKETWITEPSREHSVILRVEEQYLIRAEARAHQDDLIGAAQDLNVIRNRAGLDDTTADTKDELLRAILDERQVEFFLELAHRWFDLKRMGFADEVLGAIKPGWDPTDVLLPVPETEILINPNLLPQNDGY